MVRRREQFTLDKAKIYKITNTKDDTYYIGSTKHVHIDCRLIFHKQHARKEINMPFHRYINKNVGWDNVKMKKN